jgi:predicted MPP superfamily phosphohydrolase
MRSLGQLLAFLTVFLLVIGGWHYYLFTRLVRDPAWPAPYARIATVALIVLAVLPPFVVIASRVLPRDVMKILSAGVFTWFGLAFLLGLSFFAADLGRLILRAWQALQGNAPPDDPERRQFVARSVAEAAGLTVAALGAVSVRSALADVEVPEVEVRLPRLPRALSGLTIVQLSDVHIGPTIGRRFLEHVVEKSNAQKPDAIVITGDLVDGSVASLRQHVEPLARLKARHGVFFVTGNHEYYSGVDEWLAELERLGIRVLRNERASIGDAGASLDLAGVDDQHAHGFGPGHGADYEKPFRDRDPERELVVLAHQPSQIAHLAAARPGLQLSGHTHGGQIWPFGALVRLNQPYIAGLHRHDDTTQIYVSRGTGYWGPPMRLFCPAEITKLVLTPA